MINPNFVTPQNFGALYDGAADDTTPVNKALQFAAVNQMSVYFPPGKGAVVSQAITVPSGVRLIMDAPLIYKGDNTQPCLLIGNAIESTTMMDYKLNVRNAQVSDWSNEGNIGIILTNFISCNIDIVGIDGFTIGLQAKGNSKGFSFNKLTLGQIMNNKIALDLSAVRSGWVNENLFENGRFGCWSQVNTNASRYGIRIVSPDNSYFYNNNNVFIKPSFELGQSYLTGNAEAVPLLIYHGEQNKFQDMRNEDNNTTFVRVFNSSSNNVFNVGYGELNGSNIDDRSRYPVSVYSSRKSKLINTKGNMIFLSGSLNKIACYYNGNSLVNIPRVNVATSRTSTVLKSGAMTLANEYVELIQPAIGVFINTSKAKRFIVQKDTITGYGGRVIVICYDANGNILGSTIQNEATVKGSSNAEPYFNTTAPGGGAIGGYITGSDSNKDFYFRVHSDVTMIRVLLSGGTQPLRIKSFCIYSIDCTAAVWSGYEEIIPGVNLGTQPPTAGQWDKGRMILNDNLSLLGTEGSKYVVEGWQCILAPNQWIEKRSYTGL
ncbi:hypothetical protein RQP50_01275 [Paenibacillus sp. chi10]|uniref:Pectate lyase superfamily protein domain-containing protein n=1 Tax=Paenibacillus suaedae TaxID=3077233 RepID=A0AAJ2JS88_9BACL|nr:hypothetical protein [Paenibacillus sp. chi10]MDT8974871.1 hypothetical protein [Paenibacillus sp. chi10]